MAKGAGNFKFKAEVRQLLEILVHSLYSNKEIFLRELVSNASDALDKVRFRQIAGEDVLSPDDELDIRITTDKDANILRVVDTGIGMTRDELVDNIGTIAHSGTADFVRQAQEAQKAEDKSQLDSIIGQFGVGFYSVFMVADEVVVTTRSATAPAESWVWKSKGEGTFTITPGAEDAPRGTTVEVHLKEDAKEYAELDRLKHIVERHSNFVSHPIFVGEDRVNTVPALWREPKFSIQQEQYDEFYKFLTFDSEGPADVIHTSADAPIQFNTLLFVPQKNTDMLSGYQGQHGVDLYVRRVLIQHQNKDILPEYLGFLRGVVDSEDLPLNISRETLQENVLLRKISSSVVKHVLSHLKKKAKNEPEKYAEFWNEHGKIFKLGYSDFANRDDFAELLRFESPASPDLASFDQYIERFKPDQKDIYYVTLSSREAAETSPHLEIFRKKGVEVLFLYEPIDEFVMDSLAMYKEHRLVSVELADLSWLEGLPDETDDEDQVADKPDAMTDEQEKTFEGLLARMKEILGERITEVRTSKRLKDSPVCLVSPDSNMTSGMQKIMRLMSKDESVPPKAMEVNPDSPLVRNLLEIYQKDSQDDYLNLATEHLYEAALLLEGYLTDPHGLVSRIQDHLTRSSGWYKGE
jgi:molecular chaperone HtpG